MAIKRNFYINVHLKDGLGVAQLSKAKWRKKGVSELIEFNAPLDTI